MRSSSVSELTQVRGARAAELADLMARLMMLLSAAGDQRQMGVLEGAESTRQEPDPKPANEEAAVRVVLTVEQAAERLGIGRTLMYSLVSAGDVESVTIGRLRRIPADALVRYVEGLRAGGEVA